MAGGDADADRKEQTPAAPEPRLAPRRGLRARVPITAQPAFEPLEITGHRELVVRQADIVARLHAHPDLATMLFVNPVLAFREFGVSLSSEMANHLLHALQHPPALRKRREELEASLTKALDGPPQPNDPQWLAAALFERLQLAPVDATGREPTFKPALPPEAIERLQQLRPAFRNVRGDRPRRLGGMRLRLTSPRGTARRLDLDATVPELPPAKERPAAVTLSELWFYKDAHPVARELLELAIIRRRAFPVHSGDSYRKIRNGEKPNAFRGWITGLRFPTIREERDRTKPDAGEPR